MPKKITKSKKALKYKELTEADAQRLIMQNLHNYGDVDYHVMACLTVSEICNKGDEILENINSEYILSAMKDYHELMIYWEGNKDCFIEHLEKSKKPKLKLIK